MDSIKEEVQKKNIIIGLPGDNFSSRFLISWTNTLSALITSNKYNITIAPSTGSYVSFVRMHTLGIDVRRGITQKPFNGAHFDVWITIDSDIIFSPESFISLIESTDKYPVVSGIYRMSDLVNFAVVKDWDLDFYRKNGTFEFLSEDKINDWKKETNERYMTVSYTGMGFFACRKEVLDKMTYPYFDGKLNEISDNDGLIMKDLSSEDVNFCKNIQSVGYDIVLDTELRVGHLKPIVI